MIQSFSSSRAMLALAAFVTLACNPPPPGTGSDGGTCQVVSMATTDNIGLEDGTPCTPAGAADITLGHALSTSAGYQIYGNIGFHSPRDGNCHNAALNGPRTGVVICQGDPTMANANYVNMSQYHTFVWQRVEAETAQPSEDPTMPPPELSERYPGMPATHPAGTIFYNWSGANGPFFVEIVVPQGGTPNMQDGAAADRNARTFLRAAQWGCGNQFTATTRAVNGDGDLENPNAGICAAWVTRHAQTICDPRAQCIQCCHDRSARWRGQCGAGPADEASFDTQCVAACQAL